MSNPTVSSDPLSVTDRLAAMGLSEDLLVQAVQGGQIARDTCTLNDPPILYGVLAWGRTIRALRELLIPLGWRRSNRRGLSTVVSQDGKIRLAVATGDESTGQTELTPKTRHPKGPETLKAVEMNRQLALAGFLPVALDSGDEDADSDEEAATWILLISRFPDRVQIELSLPAVVGIDNRVVAWSERIILRTLPLGLGDELLGHDDADAADDVDVPVTKKGA